MRKNHIALGLLVAILLTTNSNLATSQTQDPASTNPAKSSEFIPGDTPLRLRLSQTLSSATAKVDEKVDFEVVESIKVGDIVVIPQGSTAIGTVTEAKTKKSFGRAGKLNVNIDYVRLANGDKVSLRAVKGGSGGSHTGVMTGAVVATAIVFFPAAPLFFFIKGKNIVIPKGTEITAFVAADTPIDPAKFNKQPTSTAMASSQLATEPTPASDSGAAAIKSSPDGADITIDGKFVGTSPSNLQLKAGEHSIVIEKSGFKTWQRTLNLTAGSTANLEVTLDKLP